MPQVDKATFFPIVFWTFVLYVGGYLFLNLSFLFTFFSSMKVTVMRNLAINGVAAQRRAPVNAIVLFPWLSL